MRQIYWPGMDPPAGFAGVAAPDYVGGLFDLDGQGKVSGTGSDVRPRRTGVPLDPTYFAGRGYKGGRWISTAWIIAQGPDGARDPRLEGRNLFARLAGTNEILWAGVNEGTSGKLASVWYDAVAAEAAGQLDEQGAAELAQFARETTSDLVTREQQEEMAAAASDVRSELVNEAKRAAAGAKKLIGEGVGAVASLPASLGSELVRAVIRAVGPYLVAAGIVGAAWIGWRYRDQIKGMIK